MAFLRAGKSGGKGQAVLGPCESGKVFREAKKMLKIAGCVKKRAGGRPSTADGGGRVAGFQVPLATLGLAEVDASRCVNSQVRK